MATETIDKLTLICETCNSIVDHPNSPEHDKSFALQIQAWADDCKPLLEACTMADEQLKDIQSYLANGPQAEQDMSDDIGMARLTSREAMAKAKENTE